MKILTNSIKVGNILVYKEDLYTVVKQPEHTKPGKGPAYIQVEMKNLKTNIKINIRFNASEYVEKAHIECRDLEFLYFDKNQLVLMDKNTFEQFFVNKNLLDGRLKLLENNMILKVQFFDANPINISLPQTVICEIEQTEPIIKSATVTSSYKPAILINGLKIMVPHYLTTGDKIVIKTEDLTFVERIK